MIETTTLPFNDVAFAAGFASLRQFNDTVRAVFARTPTEIRRRAGRRRHAGASPPAALTEPAALLLRLPRREPFDGAAACVFSRPAPFPASRSAPTAPTDGRCDFRTATESPS